MAWLVCDCSDPYASSVLPQCWTATVPVALSILIPILWSCRCSQLRQSLCSHEGASLAVFFCSSRSIGRVALRPNIHNFERSHLGGVMPGGIVGKDTGIEVQAPRVFAWGDKLHDHVLDGLIELLIQSIGLQVHCRTGKCIMHIHMYSKQWLP